MVDLLPPQSMEVIKEEKEEDYEDTLNQVEAIKEEEDEEETLNQEGPAI